MKHQKKDIIYIMGDFNAKVGEGDEPGIVGKFGLGERNEAGDRLMQFCQENNLQIANTFIMQPKRPLHLVPPRWYSPQSN